MDGDMDTIVLVAGTCKLVCLTKRCWAGVAVLLLLQGKEIVGSDAAERVISARNLLGLDDGGDGNLLRLNQRRGGDGVIAGLELGETLDEGGEGNRGPLFTLANTGEETSNIVVVRAGLLVEVVLIATETVHLSLDRVVGSESSESRNELTGNRSADLEMVSQNGIVGRRVREGNLGGRLKSLNGDDAVLLAGEIENIQETVNLLTRICGPDSNVITSFVFEVRTADVDFHVKAVPVLGREELIDFVGFGAQVVTLVNGKDRLVNGFALFQSHFLSKGLPHGILPGQEVLFHGTSAIVTFTSFADAVSTKFLKSLVNFTDHGVVVFVGVVSETESDIVEVAQRGVIALVEGGILTSDELVEIDCVVGRLAFTVSCEDKHDNVVVGDSIQAIEIVVFNIGDHGVESESTLTLLGETGSIIFSGTSLRTIEDGTVLARFLHGLDDVSRATRLGSAAGSEAIGIRVLGNTP
ncbi:hypothetical protein HG531_010489 [Fusarium graminearum]|nr:hypothetical protein HG531_010489 [Fusarium graminearum]